MGESYGFMQPLGCQAVSPPTTQFDKDARVSHVFDGAFNMISYKLLPP
jgi:hypothetical protein